MKDMTLHSRTKYIDIQYCYIRHAGDAGALRLDYVLIEANVADMVADVFTKRSTEDRRVYAQPWFVPTPSRFRGSIGERQSVEVQTGVAWAHGLGL